MTKININELISQITKTIGNHKLQNEGEYARWLWQDKTESRMLGINEYGCADAANILYTLGCFPKDLKMRGNFVKTLKSFQNPATGMFSEPTHNPIHTTAHCIAALELFDALPDFPVTELFKYRSKDKLYEFLDSLDWKNNPWSESHKGAGLYVSLVLTNSVGSDWQKQYFYWLWNEADEKSGMWRKDFTYSGNAPLFHHLAGSFHYLFNHEYVKIPLRYPERMIDTCLELYENKALSSSFGEELGFLEIDWIYCLNRASRQTPHRFDDCKKALRSFAENYICYLYSIDKNTDEGFNDLHALFGSTCALAELSQALYGEIISDIPLKLVLDRRPFI